MKTDENRQVKDSPYIISEENMIRLMDVEKKIANYATDLLVDEQGYINCVDWMCCLEQALEMAIVSAAKGDEIADIRLRSLYATTLLENAKDFEQKYE